ncbi:MAG: hypothetical protein IJ565_04325 [Bacilli bacterium]|nr:hypothetical protein [Bacilli bacterium]
MKIIIKNKKLDKIISDDKTLIRTIGFELAKKVRKRCNEMKASRNFKDYLDIGIGDPHPLVGNLDDLFGIKLNDNVRLIVEPLSDNLDDESLKNCEEVNLKGVADYHGEKCEWIIP